MSKEPDEASRILQAAAAAGAILLLLDPLRLDLPTDTRVVRGRDESEVLDALHRRLTLDLGAEPNPISQGVRLDVGKRLGPDLIGRSPELEKLEQLTSSRDTKMIFVVGLGGQGKTALVQSYTSRSTETIEWVDVDDAPSLSTLVTRIQGVLSLNTNGDPHTLLTSARLGQSILVLDNAEAMLQGGNFFEDTKRFFESLFQTPITTIVLSRITPRFAKQHPRECQVLELGGLSVRGVEEYLGSLGVTASPELCSALHGWCDGNPLAIRLLVGSVAGGDFSSASMESAIKQSSSEIHALVNSHTRSLSSAEFATLVRVAWSGAESRYFREAEDADRDEIVEALRGRHLIDTDLSRRSTIIHPMIREYVLRTAESTLSEEILEGRANGLLAGFLLVDPADSTEARIRERQNTRLVASRLTRDGLRGARRRQAVLRRLLEVGRTAPLASRFLAANVLTLAQELGVPLASLDLRDLLFVRGDFRGLDLSDANLSACELDDCEFPDEFGPVTAMHLVPADGEGLWCVAGTFEGSIRWWDRSGRLRGSHDVGLGWVTWLGGSSADDVRVTTAHGVIVRIDLFSGEIERIADLPQAEVRDVEDLGEEALLACSDGALRTVSWSDGRITDLRSYKFRLKFVTISSDGLVAVGGDSPDLYLHHLGDDLELASDQVVAGKGGWTRAGFFLESGRLAVADDSGYLSLYTRARNDWRLWRSAYHGSRIWSLAHVPSLGVVLSGANDGLVSGWSETDLKPLMQFRGHSSWVRAMTVDEQAGLLFTGGEDQRLIAWNVSTRSSIFEKAGYSRRVFSVTFVDSATTSEQQIALGTSDHRVIIVDEAARSFQSLYGHEDQVYAVHSAGGRIGSVSDNGRVAVWDKCGALLFLQEDAHAGWVGAVQLSPGGTTMLTGGDDGVLLLWDLSLGITRRRRQVSNGRISSLRFLDDQTCAVASEDGLVRVLEMPSLEEVSSMTPKLGPLFALTYDGSNLYAGGANGVLWTSADQPNVPFDTTIWSLDYSSFSRVVAVGADDGRLRLVSDNGVPRTVEVGLDSQIWSVEFDNSGTRLALAAQANKVVIYNVTDGSLHTYEPPSLVAGLTLTGCVGLTLAQRSVLERLGARL